MPSSSLNPNQLLHELAIDEICQRFEMQCQSESSPPIDNLLSSVDCAIQAPLFHQLLRIELWWRRMRGEVIRDSEYRSRYPLYLREVSDAFSTMPRTPSVSLEFIAGAHKGRVYEYVEPCSCTIGRASDAGLSVSNDERMSRTHCLIEFAPRGARVIDLKSRNGTFVNEVLVTEKDLRHLDRIRVGDSAFILRYLEPVEISFDGTSPTVMIPSPNDHGSPPLIPSMAVTGLSVPGYTVFEELGRGGLGVVYRVRQSGTDIDRAAKFIQSIHADSSEATRLFLREASVLGRLKHPSIVQFIELGISGNSLYLIMEYVAHTTFARLAAQRTTSERWRLACNIVCRVLTALDYAHKQGFVHRDVKPSNILLAKGPKGVKVKLSDFGLAKSFLSAGFSGMTAEGATRGSLAFMPPEQMVDSRSAKPAADLYAVGVTLFQFITNTLPLDFPESRDALNVVRNVAPQRADKISTGLPTELADVIERALQKDPRDRFADASQMKTALLPFCQ